MYLKRLRTYKRIELRVMAEAATSKQDVNIIYDSGNYMDVFEQDLVEAEKDIIISSPDIIREKIDRLIFLLKSRQEAGVKIMVITENLENSKYGNVKFLQSLIRQMKDIGIRVRLTENEIEHYVVIDNSLVWHGGTSKVSGKLG